MGQSNPNPYSDPDAEREFREQFYCRYCETAHLHNQACREVKVDRKAMLRIARDAVKRLGKECRRWSGKRGFKRAVGEIGKL